ncbi:MAG: hypothetical protein KDE55_01080 [Novosphingobium sp.]|nr:hypothetical protein [Novosphingobium sp.]
MRYRIGASPRRLRRPALAGVLLVLGFGAMISSPARAYIGPSYLNLDGDPDASAERGLEDWVRAESNYWTEKPILPEIRGAASQKDDLLFTGPVAPVSGPEMLAVSVDKRSPSFARMMQLCEARTRLSDVVFAESSELARHPQEHGPRPSDVPEFFKYRLKGVQLECPVDPDAPEQAFVLRFDNIDWLNYRPQAKPRPVSAVLSPTAAAQLPGDTKVFAMTWFAASVDGKPDQCPKMNSKPGPDAYFRLVAPQAAMAEKEELAGKGVGPDRMSYRGPGRLNVALMPGIVADPGHEAPVGDIIDGLDLDGDDGSGPPPAGIRKHRNFVSPDGRAGIDNQLFTVEGCVEGLRRKGFLPMIFNESRVGGRPTAIISVSGIEDPVNDDDVAVSILFSTDLIQRSASKDLLTDFTYRVTDDPEFGQDFAVFPARIVDGVIVTEAIDSVHFHEILGIETTLMQPRMRLRILPDGTVKGVVGGYIDWRQRVIWQTYRAADYENTIGFQAPAIYNAMKRAADGFADPVTGEFTAISAAFDIEGIPAFLPVERKDSSHRVVRSDKPEQGRN